MSLSCPNHSISNLNSLMGRDLVIPGWEGGQMKVGGGGGMGGGGWSGVLH